MSQSSQIDPTQVLSEFKYRDAIDLTQDSDDEGPVEHKDSQVVMSDDDTEPYDASSSPPEKRMKGRITNSKSWLLTYPRCDLSIDAVMQRIRSLLKDWDYMCVSRELHQDGFPHIHAFIQFRVKKQFRYGGVLDKIGGKHGDYKHQKYGDVKSMVEYVKKHGDYKEEGHLSDLSNPNVYALALAASSVAEGMKIIEAGKPRDFCLYGTQIEQTLNRKHPPPPSVLRQPRELLPFVIPDSLEDWVTTELTKDPADRPRCLVLIGPTRSGKTQWATSLFAPNLVNFFRGEFSLRQFNSKARLNIFDDCETLSSKSRAYRKQLLTCMGPSILTDRYTPKIAIDVCQPSIVLCNERDEVKWCTDENHPEYKYWQYNCTIVEIDNKLF